MQGSNGETERENDLETWGKGKRGQGEMDGKSNMKTYNSICKIDSQWEFALSLRELKEGLCNNLEGWDGEGDWRGFGREGTWVNLRLILVDVFQKTTKFWKAIILHVRINEFFTTLFEHSHDLLLLSL